MVGRMSRNKGCFMTVYCTQILKHGTNMKLTCAEMSRRVPNTVESTTSEQHIGHVTSRGSQDYPAVVLRSGGHKDTCFSFRVFFFINCLQLHNSKNSTPVLVTIGEREGRGCVQRGLGVGGCVCAGERTAQH